MPTTDKGLKGQRRHDNPCSQGVHAVHVCTLRCARGEQSISSQSGASLTARQAEDIWRRRNQGRRSERALTIRVSPALTWECVEMKWMRLRVAWGDNVTTCFRSFIPQRGKSPPYASPRPTVTSPPRQGTARPLEVVQSEASKSSPGASSALPFDAFSLLC
jgi:hypothetical protein